MVVENGDCTERNGTSNDSGSEKIQSTKFHPALDAIFRDRIRPLLTTVNELRSLGLSQDIHLPIIAVVGDQSVGKSSVLEAISGVEFPRGMGIVTRCPLQLTLSSCEENIWLGNIKYKSRNGETKSCDLKSPSEVEKAIREAQDCMTDGQGEICSNLIEMSIQSPSSPDLTLIDLPGIARYSSELGAKVATQSKSLILSHIQRPEVIMLLVIPCHADIETIEALGIAKEIDPDGLRTIGVLTHPDLVNKGAEDSILQIAKNRKMPLKKGYVTVRCRTPQELKDKKTLKDAAEIEEQFFQTHPYYRQLDRFEYGAKTLAWKLSTELFNAIKGSIPEMLRNIQNKRETFALQTQHLGSEPPEDEDERNQTIIRLLHKFVTDFSHVATGTHRHEEERLFAQCRNHWETLADRIYDCAMGEEAEDMWDSVKEDIKNQRGTELPGFENIYPVLERTVRNKFLVLIKKPTSEFLVSVNQEVDSAIRTIADATFGDFPMLNTHIKTMSEKLRSSMVEKTREDLEKIFSQEYYVFTQDRIYMQQVSKTGDGIPKTSPISSITSASDDTMDKEKAKEAIEKLSDASTEHVLQGIKAYINIAIRRLIDYIPMSVIHYMLMQMSKELTQDVLSLITDSVNMYPLLQEDPVKSIQRNQLKEHLEKLKYAEQELAKL